MPAEVLAQRGGDPPVHAPGQVRRQFVPMQERLLIAVDPTRLLDQELHRCTRDFRVGILEQRADDILVRSRSEEHTSELKSLMRISYAVFCLKKKKQNKH